MLDKKSFEKFGARCAVYARVSTTNHQQSPDMQIRECRAYALRRGWRVTKTYVDRVSSAKERPQLSALLADAQKGLFDVVIVWKFDRMARSAIELATTLELFTKLGLSFVSITQDIDTHTPTGKLIVTILGAVAEMERTMIRERITAGLRERRAKGKHIGPPGAKRITQKMFDQAHELRQKKVTLRAIGDKLGLSAMTILKLVRREQL